MHFIEIYCTLFHLVSFKKCYSFSFIYFILIVLFYQLNRILFACLQLLNTSVNRADAADVIIVVTSGVNIVNQTSAMSRVQALTKLGVTTVAVCKYANTYVNYLEFD